MKWRWIGVLLLAFVVLAPFLTQRLKSGGAEVVAQNPAYRPVESSILTSGNFVYDGQVDLSPEIIGRVLNLYVKEGQRVVAGQPLLQIDPSTYRAALDQQQAAYQIQQQRMRQQSVALANERSRFERIAALAQKNFATKAQLDDANLALSAAQSDLRTNQLAIAQSRATLAQSLQELSKTVIKSPVSGFVTSVNIKAGETAVPSTIGIQGSSLITIAQDRSMILELAVDESDIAAIRTGQRVVIHPVSYPEVTLQGQVRFVSLAQRRNNGVAAMQGNNARTYTVKVAFDAPESVALKPSMTCRAEIFVNSPRPVLTIPIEAAFNNNTADADDETQTGRTAKKIENYVFVLSNGRARKQIVTLGAADDSHVEIKSGLSVNDRVLVGPYKRVKFLSDGEAVSASQGPAART